MKFVETKVKLNPSPEQIDSGYKSRQSHSSQKMTHGINELQG